MPPLNNGANIISGSIPTLFGNGMIGTAVTGLVRVPAFLANCTAIMMVGELVIRGLSSVLSIAGFQQQEDSWIAKAAGYIGESGVRPYKNLGAADLAVKAAAFSALGVVGSEFARIASGDAPCVYNVVLSFLGPIRISTGPYLDSVMPLIRKFW